MWGSCIQNIHLTWYYPWLIMAPCSTRGCRSHRREGEGGITAHDEPSNHLNTEHTGCGTWGELRGEIRLETETFCTEQSFNLIYLILWRVTENGWTNWYISPKSCFIPIFGTLRLLRACTHRNLGKKCSRAWWGRGKNRICGQNIDQWIFQKNII